MPELIICKDSTGQLEGFGEKGRRAWLKFRKVAAELEPQPLPSARRWHGR